MTEEQKLLELFTEAFPIEPLPAQFWFEGKVPPDDEFTQELRNRLPGRRWTDVALMDWRLIGVPVWVSRLYLEPKAFRYYLPSIIVGVCTEMAFLEIALESIIPGNQKKIPRGRWWAEFSLSFSSDQRKALTTFLADLRLRSWDAIGPSNQASLEMAEEIWSLR
jgi:hypothetical protein